MEVLDSILRHWDSCDPDGVLLPASRLGSIIGLVTRELENPALPAFARTDAAGLLSVNGGGLPPLLKLLHVNGTKTGTGEVIHFFRFWQAFEELSRRLRGRSQDSAEIAPEEEPIAEEVAGFRDALLRRLGGGAVTQAMEGFFTQSQLEDDFARVRTMSADASSWELLEAELGIKRRTQPMQMHAVFGAVVSWLRQTCDSYLRGVHASKISCLRDVVGCGRREACTRLAAAGWDVEGALHCFFAEQMPPGSIAPVGSSWSSQGVKLRKAEVECPICMHAYAGRPTESAAGAPIQLRCCFQVLCQQCHGKLINEQRMLACPFCRVVDHVPQESPQQEPPEPERRNSRRRSSSLGKIVQTADRIAAGASRVLRAGRSCSRGRGIDSWQGLGLAQANLERWRSSQRAARSHAPMARGVDLQVHDRINGRWDGFPRMPGTFVPSMVTA